MFIVTWIDLGQFHNAEFFNQQDAFDYFDSLKIQKGKHLKVRICNILNQKEIINYIKWMQSSYKEAVDFIRKEREQNKSIKDELNEINKERYR